MSDEIKVNSELPQKLATLGQVKDTLDKRDEKISSLKEDLGNLDSDLYSISSNILDTNGLLENTAIKDWGNPTIDNYTWKVQHKTNSSISR